MTEIVPDYLHALGKPSPCKGDILEEEDEETWFLHVVPTRQFIASGSAGILCSPLCWIEGEKSC